MKNCKKCQNPIPNNELVQGSIRRNSNRTYCSDCRPMRIRKVHTGPRICSKCKLPQDENNMYKTHMYCKSCMSIQVKKRMQQFKLDCINYKGGKCIDCGYHKCPAAMDFHHKYDKDFAIGHSTSYTLSDNIKLELDKCDLLCANCHREKHYISVL